MDKRELANTYRERCAKRGQVGHWFDPEATRFFNSRVHRIHALDDGRVIFTTSEQCDWTTTPQPRLHTVRLLTGDGNIVELTEFNTLDAKRAGAEFKRLVKAAEAGEVLTIVAT